MHYVTSDYQVNLATGERIIYYRFGGRAVAWRNNSGLKYLLADHLSSTHGEANESQGEMGQRRYIYSAPTALFQEQTIWRMRNAATGESEVFSLAFMPA